MVRSADDMHVLADNENELVEILAITEAVLGSRYNMKINKRETKVLIASRYASSGRELLENTIDKISFDGPSRDGILV